MGGRDIRQHPAAAAAGVKLTTATQRRKDRRVETTAFALAQHWPVPKQPQPTQVLLDAGFRAGAVARRIEIVDAQQPLPTLEPRDQPGQQGRAQIAQMQPPRRRGGIATTARRCPQISNLGLQGPEVMRKQVSHGEP